MNRPLTLAAMVAVGAAAFLPLQSSAKTNFSIIIGSSAPTHGYEPQHSARPGHVWSPGYWVSNGDRQAWVPGHWERARSRHYEQRRDHRGQHAQMRQTRWGRPGYDRDIDNDGIRNRHDRDRDGDGVNNRRDRYPNDYRYY